MADLKAMLDSQKPIKFALSREMDIDEIYNKLNLRASEFKNEFKLKKGLFGKSIQFKKDKELDVIIKVTVKGTEVKVTPILQENKTSVGVGGVNMRVDKNSVLRKGISGVMDLPVQRGQYLQSVADTIRNILGV